MIFLITGFILVVDIIQQEREVVTSTERERVVTFPVGIIVIVKIVIVVGVFKNPI